MREKTHAREVTNGEYQLLEKLRLFASRLAAHPRTSTACCLDSAALCFKWCNLDSLSCTIRLPLVCNVKHLQELDTGEAQYIVKLSYLEIRRRRRLC